MDTEKKLDQSLDQKQPDEAWTKFAPTSSRQDDDSYDVPEIRTQLPLPARPMVKGGFAIALSGSALVLVWIFFQLASGISWNNAKETTQEQKVPVAEAPSSKMTAEEKLQWCLASGRCSEQEDAAKKSTTIAKSASQPNLTKEKRENISRRESDRPNVPASTNVEHPVTISRPVRVARYVTPPPPPPILAQPTRSIRSVQPTKSFRYHPPVAPTPVAPRTVPPKLPQQTTSDPIALLAQASNLGTYTTARSGTHSASYPSSQYSRTAQLVAEQRLVDDGVGLAEGSAQPIKNRRFRQLIPVTTRIKATVATGISWVGSKTEQKFRIQTTENVKDENNNIALPKGTYLLAQVNQSNPSGYAEIQILSARINGQDKPISADAIIVQGTNGEPIQAKVKNQRGGLGKTVLTAGLAGISGAASTLNSSKIIVGDTTTISSGSNVGAAIVGGVAGSLSQEISGRVGQSTRYRNSDEPVLVLKSGTKLELFVNEPLSL